MKLRARFSPAPIRSACAALALRVAALLVLCAASSAVLDAQSRPSEYDVKAAYLLNFGKFIRIPSSHRRDQFDICVVGADPMGRALDALAAGEQVDGRPVHIRRMNDAADARSCDIAFLSTRDTSRLDLQMAALGNADVLTVGDSPAFLDHGGMVQFVTIARHVRFSVNLAAVHRTHLVLSSELLRVALSVIGNPSGGGQP